MRRALAIGAILLVLGLTGLASRLLSVPSLERWRQAELPPAAGPIACDEVRVTFLGVSTLLFRDRETALLTDGFFSRPGLVRVLLGRIEPDPERIARELSLAHVTELAAVIVVHSHYDHALDAPAVAARTGAVLVGSESTANVGRGWGLDEARIRVPRPGETLRFGAFRVTLLPSSHLPHGMAMGEIREPLVPPARAAAYREGGSYSVLIDHPSGRALVQGSAGWRPGALDGHRADVVLLGVGGLGGRDDTYRETYFREIVASVGARRVIPIHWDDFFRPLDVPLRPLPAIADDLETTLRFLERAVGADPHLDLALLPARRPVRLFGAGASPAQRTQRERGPATTHPPREQEASGG